MNTLTVKMSHFDHILAMSIRGESLALTGAGIAGLGWLEIITPIVAILGALIAIISGIYTLIVTRKKNIKFDLEIEELRARKEAREHVVAMAGTLSQPGLDD